MSPPRCLFLLLACSLLGAATQVQGEAYFLRDYQYFRPLVADIRTTQNHMRFTWDEALPFTDEEDPESSHLYWDVGFAEYFPLLGMDLGEVVDEDPLQRSGFTFFMDGGAHVLLDFSAPSAAMINTDFRVGGGVAARLPSRLRFVAARARIFHESTHLGDEYILLGAKSTQFRRYNVSYESLDLFLAADRYADWDDSTNDFSLAGLPVSYLRGYGGVRFINNDSFPGVDRDFARRDSLFASGDPELQMGGELFFRGWRPADRRPDAPFLSRWLAYQHVVVALDLYRRDRYDLFDPQTSWSRNLVVGLIYGNHFEETSEPTVKWLLSFYDGVHPHGQFRARKVKNVALDFAIDF